MFSPLNVHHCHLQPYPEPLLHILIMRSEQPQDLRDLVPQALASALFVSCATCGQPLEQCSLRLVLGRVFVLNLARLGTYGTVRHNILPD